MARARTLRSALMTVAVAAALACSLAALLALSERRAEAAFPGENGRIAFSTSVRVPGTTEYQEQIFTVEPDGAGGRKRLSNSTLDYNISPSYSPDGTKIAWERSYYVWVMNADGTGKRRFTAGYAPAFSADGRRIGFVRNNGI